MEKLFQKKWRVNVCQNLDLTTKV